MSDYKPDIPSSPPSPGPPEVVGTPSPMGRPKRRIGCFGWGLIVLAVIIVALGIFIYAGTRYIKGRVLSSSPQQITYTPLLNKEATSLDARISPIQKAFEKDTGEEFTLVLSADEVNYLLNMNIPEEEKGTSGIEIKMDGNIFKIKLTSPINEEKTHYFNLNASGKFSIKDDEIFIDLEDLKIGQMVVSKKILKYISSQLDDWLLDDPEFEPVFERVREFRIENSLLHLRLKALRWEEEQEN